MDKKRIVFMGSPDFSVATFQALSELDSVEIIAVFSQPDKQRGRGKQISVTPVKELALKLKIPVYHPISKDELSRIVTELNPDVIIVIAYGMILPKNVTDNFLCVNGHASLLPSYRGASPIQSAILNGDTKTGMTLIKMSEKMDDGPIIDIKEIPIKHTDNFKILHDALADLCSIMFCKLINNIIKGNIELIDQDNSKATYCKKILKEDLALDLNAGINENFNKIRAYSPQPGAFVVQDGKRIKILEASLNDETLIPTVVVPEGKSKMAYSDYILTKDPIIFY